MAKIFIAFIFLILLTQIVYSETNDSTNYYKNVIKSLKENNKYLSHWLGIALTNIRPTANGINLTISNMFNKITLQSKQELILTGKDENYWITCNSNSMSPTFTCKDKLIVIKVNNINELKIGDIIWYKTPRAKDYNVKYFVHRISNISNNIISTRADNIIFDKEENITFNQVKFKVIGILYG